MLRSGFVAYHHLHGSEFDALSPSSFAGASSSSSPSSSKREKHVYIFHRNVDECRDESGLAEQAAELQRAVKARADGSSDGSLGLPMHFAIEMKELSNIAIYRRAAKTFESVFSATGKTQDVLDWICDASTKKKTEADDSAKQTRSQTLEDNKNSDTTTVTGNKSKTSKKNANDLSDAAISAAATAALGAPMLSFPPHLQVHNIDSERSILEMIRFYCAFLSQQWILPPPSVAKAPVLKLSATNASQEKKQKQQLKALIRPLFEAIKNVQVSALLAALATRLQQYEARFPDFSSAADVFGILFQQVSQMQHVWKSLLGEAHYQDTFAQLLSYFCPPASVVEVSSASSSASPSLSQPAAVDENKDGVDIPSMAHLLPEQVQALSDFLSFTRSFFFTHDLLWCSVQSEALQIVLSTAADAVSVFASDLHACKIERALLTAGWESLVWKNGQKYKSEPVKLLSHEQILKLLADALAFGASVPPSSSAASSSSSSSSVSPPLSEQVVARRMLHFACSHDELSRGGRKYECGLLPFDFRLFTDGGHSTDSENDSADRDLISAASLESDQSPAQQQNAQPLPSSSSVLKPCGFGGCVKHETRVGEFSRCARCKAVVYCGRDCQRAAWKQHKAFCITQV